MVTNLGKCSCRVMLLGSLCLPAAISNADILDLANLTNVALNFSVKSNSCFHEDAADSKVIPANSERSFLEAIDYNCYIDNGNAAITYQVDYKNQPVALLQHNIPAYAGVNGDQDAVTMLGTIPNCHLTVESPVSTAIYDATINTYKVTGSCSA